MTPEQAAKRATAWANEYGAFLREKGLISIHDNDRIKDPEQRQRVIEIVYTAGLENITREKIGLPPFTDEEVLARIQIDYAPHKNVRERICRRPRRY